MTRKRPAAAGAPHRPRPCVAVAAFVAALLPSVPAIASGPPGVFYDGGLRWVGEATPCAMPPGTSWTATPLFEGGGVPVALQSYCLYSWTPTSMPPDVAGLFSGSGATDLVEDVPVIVPQTVPSTPALYESLRAIFREHIGNASLLPVWPSAPVARVVVIDSALDAAHGQIVPGTSRHGDTLAHIIEDVVCSNGQCAAEVTTALALPWVSSGVAGTQGGYIGTLSDLARAVYRSFDKWRQDQDLGAPGRLILNLSLGWEHTPGIADCGTEEIRRTGTPTRAVLSALQYAASEGALIVAAAGNDTGGKAPRTGLLCPARYQTMPMDTDPRQPLLVAASGVDYHDDPLESTRPKGIAAFAGLAIGGVAWDLQNAHGAPPPLTGSSVAAAVVSAVSAVVWAHDPSATPDQVRAIVHGGGTMLGPADECPWPSLGNCTSNRVTVCGALTYTGAAVDCSYDKASADADRYEAAFELNPAYSSATPLASNVVSLSQTQLPRYQQPTAQSAPWVFPQPVEPTCAWCGAMKSPGFQVSTPELVLDLGQSLTGTVMVVRHAGGIATIPVGQLAASTSYHLPLQGFAGIRSAYISGFDAAQQFSIMEQLVVLP